MLDLAQNIYAKESKDNLPVAVGVIVFAVFALSLGDALIKFSSNEFVVWQIFVMRSLIVLPILLVYLAVKSPEALKSYPAFGWTVLRSTMLVCMWIVYYLALPNLDLSIAAAAYYTSPIFITIFSSIFIGDKISKLGWGAVFVGFVGVLLILRPKAGDFNLYACLPIISAVLYALSMILTRTKCKSVHPLMLSVSLNSGFVIAGLGVTLMIELFSIEARSGFFFGQWIGMGQEEWLSMGLLAMAILIGSVGAAIAYQKGPPSVIGIFDFTYVGFALVWGVILFGEIPDIISLAGMAMIVSAGVMSLRQ